MWGGLDRKLADTALEIGFAIRKKVNEIPLEMRAELTASVLKSGNVYVDAQAEDVAFEKLFQLSKDIDREIRVIVDAQKNEYHAIGKGELHVWCYLDAIDGTIKLAGLGKSKIPSVGNNGCWAAGIAFSTSTQNSLEKLTIKDFHIAAIVDGNPTQFRAYPPSAVSFSEVTYESDGGNWYPLTTSTQKELARTTLIFDGFQAYDRNSAPKGCEDLVVEVYRKISNRNEGGAFDVVRMYGTMGEVLRQLLERKGHLEPQGGGAVALNENLPNLIPLVPILEGAGAQIVTFEGELVRDRSIISPRPNVIYAANPALKDTLLDLVRDLL